MGTTAWHGDDAVTAMAIVSKLIERRGAGTTIPDGYANWPSLQSGPLPSAWRVPTLAYSPSPLLANATHGPRLTH